MIEDKIVERYFCLIRKSNRYLNDLQSEVKQLTSIEAHRDPEGELIIQDIGQRKYKDEQREEVAARKHEGWEEHRYLLGINQFTSLQFV